MITEEEFNHCGMVQIYSKTFMVWISSKKK